MPGSQRLPERVVPIRALGSLRHPGCPSLRLPPLRWILHEIAGDHGHDQKCDTEVGEGRENTHALDEPGGDRRRHQCSCAEPPHGNPGNQSSAVREPLDQDRYGDDVAETHSRPADHAVGQVEPPQSMIGETRKQDADAVQKAAREGDDPGSLAVEPEAAHKSGDAQDEDADGEGKSNFGNAPAKLARQRHPKDAPGIDGAQCDLQKHPRNSNAQTIRLHSFLRS